MARTIPSQRDALVAEFLPLADALAGRVHRRFPDLLERDDLIQEARLALVKAAARLSERRTAPAYLKRCISGDLLHYLRDRALLVRLPASARATAPWRHLSLDAPVDAAGTSNCCRDGATRLDQLAAPCPTTAADGRDEELHPLLEQLPAGDAATLRLTLLEGLSLRQAAARLGVSAMTVSRTRNRAIARLRSLTAS